MNKIEQLIAATESRAEVCRRDGWPETLKREEAMVGILKAFLEMREALGMVETDCVCYPGNQCSVCHAKDVADAAMKALP